MDETETLGKYLKRERELRKISLREVSRNTRVREHLLKAIEEERYDLLPPATIIKGFLHSYAKYIGLDPKDLILRYETGLRRGPISPPDVPAKKRFLWNRRYLWYVGIPVVGVVILALIASYLLSPRPTKPALEPPSSKLSPKPEVKEIVSPPPPAQIAEPNVSPEEKPFTLKLKAVERTWLNIQVDSQPEKEMTLQPGEEISYPAAKRIQLLVGNAGGLELNLNGRPLERFGKSGEVVTLIFTPQGVETKRHELKPSGSSMLEGPGIRNDQHGQKDGDNRTF